MFTRKQNLRAIRTAKGRSIRSLAEVLNVDRGTIYRIETGYYLTHGIDDDKVKALYVFYGPAVYTQVKSKKTLD